MPHDTIWLNCRAATMVPGGVPYGAIDDAAIVARDGRIAWIGERGELPAETGAEVIDLQGRWVTPGLIDCHTHIVFGGDRAREFEMRLEGASYEDIARAGGGIVSTVHDTRAASEEELLADAIERARELIAEGVTVLEIKSGYGLDMDTELRMLRVARQVAEHLPVTVRTTCLVAHALPPEYQGRHDDYIDDVCRPVIARAAKEGLADAVDGFCERIAFDTKQIARVFDTARDHGLPVKLHAEQLSDQGGTQLAARYSALSMDHLEYITVEGVKAMAESGSAAVMLPGAFYTLRETQVPPIDLFREYHIPMAVATDANPGSSPARSLLLMLNMASTLFRMTPEEAVAGVTREAARALGLQDNHGTVEPGRYADLAVWSIDHPSELAYWIKSPRPVAIYRHGRRIEA